MTVLVCGLVGFLVLNWGLDKLVVLDLVLHGRVGLYLHNLNGLSWSFDVIVLLGLGLDGGWGLRLLLTRLLPLIRFLVVLSVFGLVLTSLWPSSSSLLWLSGGSHAREGT